MILLLLAAALAQEKPVLTPISGECSEVYALVPGKPLPEGLLDKDGLVACGATVLPSGKALYYRQTHTWANNYLEPQLFAERLRSVEKDRIYEEHLKALRPRPFDKPEVQRSLGRLETLVTVAAVAAVAYSFTRLD